MSDAEAVNERPGEQSQSEEEKEETVSTSEPPPPQQRAKKAQGTKRVNVNSASTAKTKSSKPAKITEITEDDTGNEEDSSYDEEEDLASKILQGLLYVFEKVLRLSLWLGKCSFKLLCGLFNFIKGSLPFMVGTGLYALLAYLIGTYAATPVTEADVPNFDARLKFLLRCEVWPTLPVFLATFTGTLRRHEVHKAFAREAFEQALLFLFNLLLLSTHVQNDCLLWVWVCCLTASVFSLIHWICRAYTKRPSSVFCFPGTLINYVMMAYNLYIIFGQELGYVPITVEKELRPSPVNQGNRGWFF